MQINVRNPPGTPLEVTNDDVGPDRSVPLKQPEVEMVQSVIGSSPNGMSGIFSGNNTGYHDRPAGSHRKAEERVSR